MTIRSICAFTVLGFSVLQAQSAWVVDSLQRVGMTDAAGATTSIALYAGKGEAESFQVIVHAPSSGLTITNLTASNLTGPSGATISQQDFTFYREYYVNVAAPSGPNLGGTNLSMGAGWYPDPLIPFKNPATGQALSGTYDAVPYALAGNQNQPFWIDINVPPTAVAGLYSGTVTMTTSLRTFTVPITLQVWNFSLPTVPRLKASFGFGGNATVAELEVLLQHRISPFIIGVSQVSALKPYGAEITGLSFFNLSSGCTVETMPALATVAAAVAQYGGFPTYLYPMDEVSGCPNLAQNLELWAQLAHGAGTKTLVTVIPEAALLNDGTGTGRTDVDYWVILPKQYAASMPEIPTVLAKGNEIWSYNSLVQDNYSPKWEIDFAPINYRIYPGFINQQFQFTGMLYSRVNRWTSNPWNNVNTFQIPPYVYAGEQMLVYPGQEVGLPTSVVPSLRLKFIRDGFDDYDYIALLKDQGDTTFVDSIVNSIAPDWTNWTKSTATLLNARIQMGNELHRLAGGSIQQQVATPTFSPTGGTYATAQSVAISTTTAGDSIRYTTDGSMPSSTVGTLYSGPITVSSSMTVKAIGYMSGWTNSTVSSASYTINQSSFQPPSNPWPLVGATGVATSLTLQCNAVTGATEYQFYLGTSSSALPLLGTGTASGSVVRQAALNLASNATYYWKVIASNGVSSASSPIWSFTTDGPVTLLPPSNPWPTNGATGLATSLTLQCNAVTGATEYQFYFGASSTALTLLATGTAAGGVVRQPVLHLAAGTTYYWKVVAMSGGTTASGPVWSFTTN